MKSHILPGERRLYPSRIHDMCFHEEYGCERLEEENIEGKCPYRGKCKNYMIFDRERRENKPLWTIDMGKKFRF